MTAGPNHPAPAPAGSPTRPDLRAVFPGAMHEIRLVGRGGTGVVTASELIGKAAMLEGRYAQALPAFGPERRGALATGVVRLSDERILLRCGSMRPHAIAVFDPTIWHVANVALGLEEHGVLVFNTPLPPDDVEAALRDGHYGYRLGVEHATVLTVDATAIALKHLGRAITNTAMIGALAAGTGLLSLDTLEAVFAERFGDDAQANLAAARAAADNLKATGA